jgi:hypothetical protein
MKKIFVVLGLSALFLAACASTQPAAPVPGPAAEKSAGSGTVSADLEALQTAHNLAKYGYRTESPSALIAAAEILAQVRTQPLGAEAEVSGAAAGEGAKTEKPDFSPVNLLADARKLAAGDTALLAWADDVEAIASVATRGAVGGSRYQVDRVAAGATNTYKLSFRNDGIAEIAVSGDGDTDLDLYVYDSSGNLIGYDEGYSDDCYVRWQPKWTGAFTIVVKNHGGVYNQFEIATN